MLINLIYLLTVVFIHSEYLLTSTPTVAYVKENGNERNSGLEIGQEKRWLSSAYGLLGDDSACSLRVVNDTAPQIAEMMELKKSKGITIEGWKSDGSGNTEVAINCDVHPNYHLFTCIETIVFKFLKFHFPTTLHSQGDQSGAYYCLIEAYNSSLTISNCNFKRPQYGNSEINVVLVSASGAFLKMDSVSCTDEYIFSSFLYSPFRITNTTEVFLNGVEINKANIRHESAILINEGYYTCSKVSVEGLKLSEVKSEKGKVAGLHITTHKEESTVEIGRTSKCTFKSCSAPEGLSGAIFFNMFKATSNLQLPATNNLDIDSSNTAGSKPTSLFILASDVEEFCKQEDAFEFANDYGESAAGWIVGAKEYESDPIDIVEKYVKKHNNPKNDPATEDKKKSNAGTVVAIVVPIVVVVIAVVVVVIVIVVVKKKKSKGKNESNEQEMSS
ncbi:uncharacterized protein MONOS_8815 [Monocercomonoides exilis]|uniref:uncharacterized protein n=1 Tax=Monocercomonoides exilis TaxID=2049356 RepID=UPI00355A39C4|nr:hypothetical protein MONOS_8815 [Monocercomonoides exilis]|eukprot:MONOS_8815.1-p1 / transcript=MONOS_8815.1 / gene=MONOS_8815 / organism=Monocercomonoides_exilis_PA203 / gene_product=unspecified product / transcript_product=unspecified product / location=Mono_scaffold00343:35591-36925(+) / protein_length=445 / sequence_SO=supercontig / SO=protein_coding / is_pseudo=false